MGKVLKPKRLSAKSVLGLDLWGKDLMTFDAVLPVMEMGQFATKDVKSAEERGT
jgi:hypothetical protein